jgi:hypothetical protein
MYNMYTIISYWKSVLYHNFISKITLFCENRIILFPGATAVAIVFYNDYNCIIINYYSENNEYIIQVRI